MKGGKVEPIAIIKGGKTTKFDERRAAAAAAAAPRPHRQRRRRRPRPKRRRSKQPAPKHEDGALRVPFFSCRDEADCRQRRDLAQSPTAARRPREPAWTSSCSRSINGLTLGSVYAVVALGYTMVYGIIQLINFAHGEVVMIGAMVAFSVISALAGTGLPPLADRASIGTLVRGAGVHGGRLRDRARRLPAAAPRAAPRAADHRDRRLDHPAAPGDADLEPQHPRRSRRSSSPLVPPHGIRRRDHHQRADRDHRRRRSR